MPSLESALLTAEDYRRLTPEFGLGPRYQLVEGELLRMAAPNRFHQEISSNLSVVIGVYVRKFRLGVVYTAPFDVYVEETNVFQPDLLFVSRERAADVLVPEGALGAPDLAIEILSPSTATLDRRQKRAVYARAGTSELWLIDPERFKVEVFLRTDRMEQPSTILDLKKEPDAFIESACLPGLRITLAEIFESPFP